jgi:hypothetical protein
MFESEFEDDAQHVAAGTQVRYQENVVSSSVAKARLAGPAYLPRNIHPWGT